MTSSIKIGVIGISDGWSTQILADAIERKTGFCRVISMSEVSMQMPDFKITHKGFNLLDLDALIIKKIDKVYSPTMHDQLEIVRKLSELGVRVFSDPVMVNKLVNRLSCTMRLNRAGVPMPRTLITQEIDEARAFIEEVGAAVFKPLYSTKARGMMLLTKDQNELVSSLKSYHSQNDIMYIQEKLELPGEDLGVVFLGKDYLGTYARVGSKGSWNTTIREGGRYRSFEPTDEIMQIAIKARDAFDLDFTCVDVAETADGPVCFEVSAFGGFRGLTEGLGINVADQYVDYVIQKVKKA